MPQQAWFRQSAGGKGNVHACGSVPSSRPRCGPSASPSTRASASAMPCLWSETSSRPSPLYRAPRGLTTRAPFSGLATIPFEAKRSSRNRSIEPVASSASKRSNPSSNPFLDRRENLGSSRLRPDQSSAAVSSVLRSRYNMTRSIRQILAISDGSSWFQCRSQRLARRFELERERRARRHSSARAPRPQPPHPSTNMSPVTTRTSPRLKTASEDGPAKVRRAHAAAPASSPVARSPSLPGFRAGRARATDRARRRDRRDARASRAVASFPRVRARRRAASACSAPYARRRARLAASRVSKRPPLVVARLL